MELVVGTIQTNTRNVNLTTEQGFLDDETQISMNVGECRQKQQALRVQQARATTTYKKLDTYNYSMQAWCEMVEKLRTKRAHAFMQTLSTRMHRERASK